MEQDARDIADRIHALAVKMDAVGLPAQLLLNSMLDICALGATFGYYWRHCFICHSTESN
jgi:hypothetical protein